MDYLNYALCISCVSGISVAAIMRNQKIADIEFSFADEQ